MKLEILPLKSQFIILVYALPRYVNGILGPWLAKTYLESSLRWK